MTMHRPVATKNAAAGNIGLPLDTEDPLPDLISGETLIQRFCRGDRDAFTALYHIHQPAVFRFAFHMTGDSLKAAEITQDVFVWLVNHADQFDIHRGTLAAFLAGIARRLLQSRERAERRWLPFHPEMLARFRIRDAVTDVTQAIDADALRTAIALLPLPYREAIVLCDLEGSSYEEAARVLQCAVGTVRSRLHRGRELLARKLQINKEGRP